jgi:hypothetical protein
MDPTPPPAQFIGWAQTWTKVKNAIWTSYDFLTEAGWIVASSAFMIAYPLALSVLDDRFMAQSQQPQ